MQCTGHEWEEKGGRSQRDRDNISSSFKPIVRTLTGSLWRALRLRSAMLSRWYLQLHFLLARPSPAPPPPPGNSAPLYQHSLSFLLLYAFTISSHCLLLCIQCSSSLVGGPSYSRRSKRAGVSLLSYSFTSDSQGGWHIAVAGWTSVG